MLIAFKSAEPFLIMCRRVKISSQRLTLKTCQGNGKCSISGTINLTISEEFKISKYRKHGWHIVLEYRYGVLNSGYHEPKIQHLLRHSILKLLQMRSLVPESVLLAWFCISFILYICFHLGFCVINIKFCWSSESSELEANKKISIFISESSGIRRGRGSPSQGKGQNLQRNDWRKVGSHEVAWSLCSVCYLQLVCWNMNSY